jgi:hypothetical protein
MNHRHLAGISSKCLDLQILANDLEKNIAQPAVILDGRDQFDRTGVI